MTKKIIFQCSFLVAGIMCHEGCGVSIQTLLTDLDDLKKRNLLPHDAQLTLDAEPQSLGIHRLFLQIESEITDFDKPQDTDTPIYNQLKVQLEEAGFDVLNEENNKPSMQSIWVNWINLSINALAIGTIFLLSLVFPPSLLLTTTLTLFSFATTAWTSRHYLLGFINNLRRNDLANMNTSITLGWLLSLAHSLYHSISMPLAISFSMVFMGFIMPILLISIINGMDEIKRLILNKSKTMHLQGMRQLFPQMKEEYAAYTPTEQEQAQIKEQMDSLADRNADQEEPFEQLLHEIETRPSQRLGKKALMEGMILTVQAGECFPVDGLLIKGSTQVDASLMTGEPQQNKKPGDFIPAGAINLDQTVTLYVTKNAFNSTVNALLFRSNRAAPVREPTPNSRFIYLYTGLITLGLVASVILPLALGLLSIPLVLQNITGILFAICPCTLLMAHQLPKLLSLYARNQQGIGLHHGYLMDGTEEPHTIVFDKTGTLTTGQSVVHSFEGLSEPLWQRIYLLEKAHGRGHPLAKAITTYYEKTNTMIPLFQDIKNPSFDPQHRGVSAEVQGRPIHLGNSAYLRQAGIILPNLQSETLNQHLEQGYSPVYVAQDGVYQGVILIKHEIRAQAQETLTSLKNQGTKLIMLTGDTTLSAVAFNRQNTSLFHPNDVHAEQTPQNKEAFLNQLMEKDGKMNRGVWFVGDGLNDAPCARLVSEKGGVSCAMNAEDKAAFFTDLSLNGRMNYLFLHHQLNRFLKKNGLQNQWIVTYGALAFVACILACSFAGIAVSPLLSMGIMVATTVLTLFNSYRVRSFVDNALNKETSWLNKFIAADWSIGLLISASALFLLGVLLATITSGALALPFFVFFAGPLAAASSLCVLSAGALLTVFTLFTATALLRDTCSNPPYQEETSVPRLPTAQLVKLRSETPSHDRQGVIQLDACSQTAPSPDSPGSDLPAPF